MAKHSDYKSNSYLKFLIGKENYAIGVEKVVNIQEMHELTQVPESLPSMAGLLNLRGEVLPVIDTKIKLGMGKTTVGKDTCILVSELTVESEYLKFGIIVDAVLEVAEYNEEEILPTPIIGNRYKSELISGVIEQGEQLVLLIDLNKLLSQEETNKVININKN